MLETAGPQPDFLTKREGRETYIQIEATTYK
jgi:hypothetical protein